MQQTVDAEDGKTNSKSTWCRGNNLLLVKVSERGGGWGMYVGIRATVEGVYKSPTELGTAVEVKDKLVTTWGKLKSTK